MYPSCTGVVPSTPQMAVDGKDGENGTLLAQKHGNNCKSHLNVAPSDRAPTAASVVADVTRSHMRTLERHKFVIVIGFVISIYVFYLVVYVVLQYLRVCSFDVTYGFKFEFHFLLYNRLTKMLFSTLCPRPSSPNVYSKHSSACIQSSNRSAIFEWLNFARKCNGTLVLSTTLKLPHYCRHVCCWSINDRRSLRRTDL